MNARRTGAAVALLALALAACGGGSGVQAAVSGSTAATTAATAAGAGATTAAGAGGSTTTPSFSGSGSSDLCSYAKQLSSSDLTGDLTGDAATVKKQFAQLDDVLKNLQDKAPAEIKSDVVTLSGAFKSVEALYAKYDYDLSKLTAAASANPADFQALETTFSDPKFEQASERIDAYFSKVCGIDTSGADTTT